MKTLFYDIETSPIKAYIWRPGKQIVRPYQLDKECFINKIICITYCWNDGKPAKAIGWGFFKQDTASVIKRFDKIIEQADITIGKNSDRFDVKHINTHRMLAGLPGMPSWATRTEDLEKQLRKHFALPSFSLDYVSELLGFGGKIKMEFQDWIDILEKKDYSKYLKMLEYGTKDTEDTRAIWNHCEKHFTPKWNISEGKLACYLCGSCDIIKIGPVYRGKTMYQRFRCKSHQGEAGHAPILTNGKLGRMGK